MNNAFNFQPELSDSNLLLRPLKRSDFDEFYRCASDPKIWAGHPHVNRYQLIEFQTYFKAAIESKACLVVIDKSSGEIIGSSRFYLTKTAPEDISIGFTFLSRKYWGGKTNYQLKRLMLDYAFNDFSTVWFHVGKTNIRSQRATLKIGAKYSHEEILDISGKNVSWFCYKILSEDWLP